MHQVKRAIIMAAGMGSRMNPVTLTTPKPLVEVNGHSMLETVIDGLHANGIFEIYIVIGYLKEQFYKLKDRFPQIVLLENPYFDTCNNISSLYIARDYLEDAIIIDGDQIIRNASILKRDFERSGYNAIWTDVHTNEWLLTLTGNTVSHCSRTGGSNGWQLFSISRWTAEDGKRLKLHLETVFKENKRTDLYWDDVALFCYPGEYELGVFPMQAGDVLEIDSLSELATVDHSYKKYLTGE